MKMLIEHTLTVVAKCPVNGLQDVYRVTFRMCKFVPIENILAQVANFASQKIFQEDLTGLLAKNFNCEVESIGTHSGVETRVVCK